jgi:tyrosine 3-monooxygenase
LLLAINSILRIQFLLCFYSKLSFFNYSGDPIPKVVYADDEIKTWNLIYNQLNEMYTSYACKEHIEAFKQLEDANIYSPHFIPQLEDVSKFLKSKYSTF